VLKNRLEQFKKRQRDDAAKVQAELGGTMADSKAEYNFGGDMHADVSGPAVGDEGDEDGDEDDWVEAYQPEMSPPPADPKTMVLDDRRLPIVSEEDFFRDLFLARRKVAASDFIPKTVRGNANITAQAHTAQSLARPSAADLEAERIYREEAEREAKELGTDESEEEFGDLDDTLANQAPTTYDWTDRYRPRKPRYFNRVQTGFEWSKYNQTHYE
jgi:hypothetical protein